jgi:nuclear transport factor 2 (NTF2) superfamily protein
MNSTSIICPPFDQAKAIAKVRVAENAWNSRDPLRVSMAYSEDSLWRNRDQFIQGRGEIVRFLTAKWEKELDYRLVKEMWAFSANRIAVRFQYEWHDVNSRWFRSYGNELWEFDEHGLMRRREASINDVPIQSQQRRFLWSAPGHRPELHPELGGVE